MKEKSPKLFLFDLDGTLMTTGGAGLRSLSRACHDLYKITDVTKKIRASGKTDPAIFREIIDVFLMRQPTHGELDAIAENYLRHLKVEMEVCADARVMKGVNELLDFLQTQKHILVGLGTGNLQEGARLKLAPVNLNRYFPFGGFGSDAEDRADVLRAGHRSAECHGKVEISPQDVFIIGDTPLDIRAAKRAGFHSVAVATGSYSYDELKQENPDTVMNDLTEAFSFIENL